jgi:hypothetical protein
MPQPDPTSTIAFTPLNVLVLLNETEPVSPDELTPARTYPCPVLGEVTKPEAATPDIATVTLGNSDPDRPAAKTPLNATD